MSPRQTGGDKVPRRRSATREQLVTSAKECFLERGFHGSSVDWLAERAGYTIGAIYSSFGSKAGLFLAVLDRRSEEQVESWGAAALASDPTSAVAKMLEKQFADEEFLPWSSAYFEFVTYAARDPKLKRVLSDRRQRMNAELETALEPLTRHSAIPAPDFAKLLRALSNGLVLSALVDDATDVASMVGALLPRLYEPPAGGRRSGADPAAGDRTGEASS